MPAPCFLRSAASGDPHGASYRTASARSSSGSGAGSAPAYPHDRPHLEQPGSSSYAGMHGERAHRTWGYDPAYPDSAGAPSSSSSGGGQGGISGYLKAFAKKAVKATKAGLAQLEAALEDHAHKR